MKTISLLLAAFFFVCVPSNLDAQPSIIGCPSDIISCNKAVTWTPPSLNVNYQYTFNSNYSPGATFPFGTTRVVYTFEDNNGIIATCSFNVTVEVPDGDVVMALSNDVFTGGLPNQIFLGYGPQSMLLLGHPDGIAYSWSPSTGLSCATCPNPLFTPTDPGNYTFTATCTFSSGCTVPYPVNICVVDVRAAGNKVYVCHPQGVTGKARTEVVNPANVPNHLEHGDRLGRCGPPVCSAAKGVLEHNEEFVTEDIHIDVGPNPFSNSFYLNVSSDVYDNYNIRIFDFTGRVVEARPAQPTNHEVSLGSYLAIGIYIVEVTTPGSSEKIKVIKVQ